MFKKLAIGGVGVLLLVTPLFSSAQMDVVAQITALLAQIKALQAQIAQLQGTQSSPCVDLSQNLTLGSTGNDVTDLQSYLNAKGQLESQYATGYYGFITAQAVGNLQLNLGIVSSANDTAYGITGPRTRAAIACNGANAAKPTITSNTPAVLPSPAGATNTASTCSVDYPEGANIRNSTQSSMNACKSYCDSYGYSDAESHGGAAVCRFQGTQIASYSVSPQPTQPPFVTVSQDNGHYFIGYAYLRAGMYLRLIGVDAPATALPIRATTNTPFTGLYTNNGVWYRVVANSSENIDLTTSGTSIPSGTYVLEVSDPAQNHVIILRTSPFSITNAAAGVCRIDYPEGANIRSSLQSTSAECRSYCDVYGNTDAASNGGATVCKFQGTQIASYTLAVCSVDYPEGAEIRKSYQLTSGACKSYCDAYGTSDAASHGGAAVCRFQGNQIASYNN